MFYGEYTHTLDKKGRLIIPSKFREAIQETGVERLYITRGLEQCLFVFAENEWKAQEAKLKSMSFMKSGVRRFKRIYYSGAVEAEPDKQWRILIPDYLRDYAHLAQNIRIIGVSDRFEIWDTGKWKEFYESAKKEYESIAENLMDEE